MKMNLSKIFNRAKIQAKNIAIGAASVGGVTFAGTAFFLSPFLAIPAAAVGAGIGGYIAYKNNKPK